MTPPAQTTHARALLEALLSIRHSPTTPSSSRRPSNGYGGTNSLLAPAVVGPMPMSAAASASYRPQKPSSLAASSTSSVVDGHDEPDLEAEVQLQGVSSRLHQLHFPSFAFSQLSSSAESASEGVKSPPTPPLAPLLSPAHIAMHSTRILGLLDSADMQDEDRIEQVRDALAEALKLASDGEPLPPSRLDALVLDLLHRHREDVRPSGAVVPNPLVSAVGLSQAGLAMAAYGAGSGALTTISSPNRRPASLRTFSNSSSGVPHPHLTRPWTPTSAAAANAAHAGPRTPSAAASGSSPLPSPAFVSPTWGNLALGSGPENLSVFNSSAKSGADAWPTPASPTPAHLHQAALLGSSVDSQRASPRPWHRSGSFLGKEGGGGGGGAAWSSSLGLAPSTPFAGTTLPSSSSGSTSTGLPAGMSPALLPTSAGAAAAAANAASTRPLSPSPLGSPRLNVGASEFKPRASSGASPARPGSESGWPTSSNVASLSPSTNRRTSSQAAAPSGLARSASLLGSTSSQGRSGNGSRSSASGSGSDTDGDTDEFSPFAVASNMSAARSTSSAATSTRPNSTSTASALTAHTMTSTPGLLGFGSGDERGSFYADSTTSVSSLSGASSGGHHDASPLAQTHAGASSGWSVGMYSEEESALAATMTPFDVLFSILNSSTGAAPSSVGSASSTGSFQQQQQQWTPEQIEEALAANGWDVDATLAAIMDAGGQGLAGSPARSGAQSGSVPVGPRSVTAATPRYPRGISVPGGSGVSLMSREAFANYRQSQAAQGGSAAARFASSSAAQHPSSTAQPKQNRVCKYWASSGGCLRRDCAFLHSDRALCIHWLRGRCLNDNCAFTHSIDAVQTLASGLAAGSTSSSGTPHSPKSSAASVPTAPSASSSAGTEPRTPPHDDFPELGQLIPAGPKTTRARASGAPPGAPTGPATNSSAGSSDTSRIRWAAALQKGKDQSPMALVAGDAPAVHVHKASAPSRAPTGPRSSTSSASTAAPAGASNRPSPRIVLRPPALIPTLDTGKAAAASYASYRGVALSLSDQRNQCLARAAEAWKGGDGAGARQWSAEGQALNAKLAEEQRGAVKLLMRDRHKAIKERLALAGPEGAGVGVQSDEAQARGLRGKSAGAGLGLCLGVASSSHARGGGKQSTSPSVEERTEYLMDLHGLHGEEAVTLVEQFLLGLERENARGIAYLATGTGRHTSTSTDRRRVGLAQAVRAWLSSWHYPYVEHEGVLAVDPLTHA
ncbi:PROTEIN SUPPRESSOR OF SABLE [Ceraceosorus bombacis]|uniref:PROTEIN SUPPRESSOR OF SABLE n=1 Tax=Ceraceosorus bombacis TaxID=401625 RepID=A0A0P1BC86_9BASI|nr:PROTEIN SUPPRESSOR OF SABLE [Ceraceosorus bombacis]